MGVLGLTATGICSMMGASIYVMPFMIHRSVPGIGPYVLHAFLLAAFPAALAAFAYSILASAMPRAGGSYIYASRGLHPYFGFVASFSQWFGLSIVIGVISYIIVPFMRDIAFALDWKETASLLEIGWIKPGARKNIPGKPTLWSTTDMFLEHFGLESLSSLPNKDELKASGFLDKRAAIATISDLANKDKENAEYNCIMKECELLTKIQFLEAELNELKKREN